MLSSFHPIVSEWFRERFGDPTEPQQHGWPHILAGRHTLIAAPTGSGKTLAAFLCAIDRLVCRAAAGELRDHTDVVYVSPLKALANDVQKNLLEPLAEIQAVALRQGWMLPEIRVLVRTGDTLAWDRQLMLKRPPHILITTPESLFILLTAERSRRMLRSARVVIVDEIHAPARDKRGSHLSLSLERLDALVTGAEQSSFPDSGGVSSRHLEADSRPRLQRIGLSATVRPIDEIARLLVGANRDIVITELGHRRALDLAVEVPRDELGAVASNEMWGEIYDRIAELIQAHRTTLVFVNTRRLAERVSHHLAERLDEQAVAAHHGSLSRKLRLSAEERLKRGDLKAVVATASLELGIDIGAVDLVCQIGSPRSIALALQRVGRSGHWRGAIPRGRIFATSRDELLECAALVRAIRAGELDRVLLPHAPLDILAQQIVAAVASEEWLEDDLFALVRGAAPYADLSRADFDSVTEMLSEGIATRRGRGSAYLHRDRVNGRIRARRGARLAAITSGGAIPDNANYTVVAEPEGVTVGTVDEDFAVESLSGDVFLLGNASWRIRRVEAGRVRVEDAHGAAPTIPFWRGEAPARTSELSAAVSDLRQEIAGRLGASTAGSGAGGDGPVLDWLMSECGLNRRAAEQVVLYVAGGRAALGAVPGRQMIVAERFFDEGGGMQLVLHAPLGGRLNRAWGLALRKRFCRSFNFELQAAATDDGIVISLGEQHSFPLETVFAFLSPRSVRELLTQALLDAPMFATRWRWNASRALALLRFAGGKKVPPPIQRMRADDLLAAVFPDQAACPENLAGPDIRIPDHPLVNETIRDCLTEAMDIDGLEVLLARIDAGEIRCVAVDTREPSPFSHEILNANPFAYLDDAPLEERRARAVQTRRMLSADVADSLGALDPAAITEVSSEAGPVVRDADEMHDALLTLAIVPVHDRDVSGAGEDAAWGPFLEELLRAGRVTRARLETDGAPPGATGYWVAAERLGLVRTALPGLVCDPPMPGVPVPRFEGLSREAALAEIVRGWMDSIGPVTIERLAARLDLPAADLEAAMLQLESEGQVLRGQFTPGASSAGLAKEALDNPGRRLARGIRQEAPGTILSSPQLEWCNRRLLARIHRLTLGRLRREIEPVTAADLMRFLLRWQHVGRGAPLHGPSGLSQVIGQLQGFELPAAAWERHILPARIARYEPELLDRACLSGEVAWGRVSWHPALTVETAPSASAELRRTGGVPDAAPTCGSARDDRTPRFGARKAAARSSDAARRRVRPTRVAPIALFLREDLPWLLSLAPSAGRVAGSGRPAGAEVGLLSPPARDVLAHLAGRGASFFNEIVRPTRRLPAEVEDGLWELVAAGLVTADGFDNLRSLIDEKRRRGEGRHRSARPRHAAGRWALLRSRQSSVDSPQLPVDRRQSLVDGDQSRNPDQRSYGRAQSSVNSRQSLVDNHQSQIDDHQSWHAGRHSSDRAQASAVRPQFWDADWSVSPDVMERYARQLLRRWGVMFRDLLARESLAPAWRDLLMAFRRLEARGEIRGGRFVAGFLGEQFALPEAVEALRAIRRTAPTGEVIRLSGADPLNLAGIIVPGPRVPALLGEVVVYRDGVPVEPEHVRPTEAQVVSHA